MRIDRELTLLENFKIVTHYLEKAVKIAYSGYHEGLEYCLRSFSFDDESIDSSMDYYQRYEHDAVHEYLAEFIKCISKFTYEETGADVTRDDIWNAFEFVLFAENLLDIILTDNSVKFQQLTEGEFSFDYYIPERNLVIEITNIPEFTDNKVDNQYFKRMNLTLHEKGIKLLRFGIDDVYYKTDLVISMILHHLGLTKTKIPARKCKLVELNVKQARKFTDENHLNGFTNALIYYGLEYQGEIVQVISFAKHRYSRKDSSKEVWEVIRACSKKHLMVQGGTQKIFKYFKKLHPGVELQTYCDMNISDGNSYALIGELIEETPGDLWYIIPDETSPVGFVRVIRNRMMKIYLHKYFEGFPKRDEPGYKEINSVEFLRQQGIFGYYGSGNLVYKL